MAAAAGLAVERGGRGARLVLLHGFTLTGRCWGDLPEQLTPDHEVVALDAPGHGGSGDIRADLWETAELAVATAGAATYVGYSMGARMALHCALAHPDQVERLVLISGTPGIEDDADRAARRHADEAQADRIEAIGVSAFLDEWLALPLFSGLAPDQQDRSERERNTAAGLSSSLRLVGTGTQDPLWSRLGELKMPTLVVSGRRDAKFDAIAERMAATLPSASHVGFGVGHTVHREAPGFGEVLRRWLADTGG